MKNRILIMGATSAIAIEAAREWANRGASFYLVARSEEKLNSVVDDLKVRGAGPISTRIIDLTEYSAHASLIQDAKVKLGTIDIALLAHGELGEKGIPEKDFNSARRLIDTNYVSFVSLLILLKAVFVEQGNGVIVGISSVAGDRGRYSNYLYGSTKAGLSEFLSGLRAELCRSGVRVLTIKPGLTDTPMTRDFDKSMLFASARTVGRGVVRAVNKKYDVAYLPGFWRLILFLVRSIPEVIFKRLKF